tara:strand:- start:95 stop:388 length:294 start_codon:yes stop_codon:yes gene_type:complete
MKKARKIKKKRNKKDWGEIMGSVVLNKVNGLMSVHFYPQENMRIKKGEKLFLQGESFVRALSPDRFFDSSIYRVPIMEAYNLGKFKTKEKYLESKKK